ncbi:hypothetical protein INT47_005365, partial [Mucor saturninus]
GKYLSSIADCRETLTFYNTDLDISEVALRFYNTPNTRFADYTTAYACNCCQTYFEELSDLSDHMIQQHVPREHLGNAASFKGLNDEEKWTLSTGTVVEDILYEFGKRCIVDHPACSMILDLEDMTYANERLFTIEEIDEMKKQAPMTITSRIPQDLCDYIEHFNCDNVKDLRRRLADTQDWEKEEYDMNKHHDLDWIKHTIHFYVRLYESGELKTIQKEQWYNKHIWLPIVTVFNDISSIQIVAGELVSLALISMYFYFSVLLCYPQQIIADKPSKYITRITRLNQLGFPSEVRLFGKQVLPLLVLIWQFKQLILKTQQHISHNQSSTRRKSDWLQTCLLNTTNATIVPVTSTSTEYVSKKRKRNVK